MRKIEDFEGAILLSFHPVEDYAQVGTAKGTINPYNPIYTPVPVISAGNPAITMSLFDNEYRGPEAADFCFDSGEIIVVSPIVRPEGN